MPLFMFISGFVSFSTFDGSFKKLLKRFKSLIIPFWVWFLFAYFISYLNFFFIGGVSPNFINSFILILKSPSYGLWFLWVLFLNYMVLFFSLKLSPHREEIVIFLLFIGINIFRLFTGFNYLGIGLLSGHLLFYLFGYITNKYKDKLRKLLNILGVSSFFIFPILVLFWSRVGNPTFYPYLEINQILKLIICHIYQLIVPISGILATFVFFGWLIRYKFLLKNSFITLGHLTLEIYSTHLYLLSLIFIISFLPVFIQINIIFIVALFGSLFVQYLIKKNNFLSIIFYGKKLSPISKAQ